MNDTRLCCRRPRGQKYSSRSRTEGLQRREYFATTSRCGEETEHHQCHRTPRRSSNSSTLVAEKQQAALRAKFEEYLAKQKAAYKKRATLHGALVEKSVRNVCRVPRSTKLKLRPSLTLKRRKPQRSRTRFKRRRIHLKHSNVDQPQRRRRWLRCNRSGETVSKFKLQRTQELTRTQHEVGKQDAWNGHAQVASQAMAVPEEYGPDAERQEVKRDEQ